MINLGQYYMAILGDVYGLNCKVFDRSVDGEYTLAKLMEHAWWQNPFVNAFSEFLYKNPGRVCWVGDYATEPNDFNFNLPVGIVRPNYKKVWGNRVTYLTCQPSDFTLDDKFLINYDTRQFIDLNEYKAKSVNDDGWTIHPLPLLTAVGNGRGGGDFQDGVGIELIGTWAWHLLAFLDSLPKDFLKADIAFVEQW